MQFYQFTTEMRNDIVEAVENSLMKLGINTKVVLTAKTIRNQEYIEVITESFNTTPVIYKSINIHGSGILCEDIKYPSTYDLIIPLSYRFNYFSGGSNGVDVGTLHFRIFEKSKKVAFSGFTI